MNAKFDKPKCILIRGKPCSGKSTLAKEITAQWRELKLIDPDIVNISSKEYSEFTPRQTKNPSENVKMYCFLYDRVETLLKNNFSVIWAQPWSRIAEIELTIRNFGYYLTDLGGSVWKTDIEDIVHKLPLNLYVVEIEVGDNISTERWLQNNSIDKDELKRLNKTQKLFQKFSLDVPYLKIIGSKDDSKSTQTVLNFLNKN